MRVSVFIVAAAARQARCTAEVRKPCAMRRARRMARWVSVQRHEQPSSEHVAQTTSCLVASRMQRAWVRERMRELEREEEERASTSDFFLVETVTKARVKSASLPFACVNVRETAWFLPYSANQRRASAVPPRAARECCRRATACWVEPIVARPREIQKWKKLISSPNK